MAIALGANAQDITSTPLTLEAITDGDITLSITYSYNHPVVLEPIEYQVNGGSWTACSWPTDDAGITSSTGNWPVTFSDAIHVATGDKVAFRGNNASYYGNGTGFESHITSTADVYVYGNVMSLIHASDFATNYTMTGDWNFANLFKIPTETPWEPPVTVTTIKSHPTNDIVLPSTTLTNYCYAGLFAGCKGITRAPELPATTISVGSYTQMFRGTGLTEAPVLPATEFTPYSYDDEGEHGSIDCYMQMFQDCTELTVAPALPATTLVHGVYQNMFEGCTSLVSAPALPATDLTGGDQCYTAMFKGCTSLKNAPALPATTLDNWCYVEMFSGCTSLENAPALPATTLAEDCYHRMFEGCTSLQKAPVLPAPTIMGQVYGGMFDGCSGLTSLDVSGFKTDNVTDMSYMFCGCSGLTSLDLSSFKTDNVTEMKHMFSGCRSLTTIYAGNDWSTEKVTSGYEMFDSCNNLVGGQGTAYKNARTDHTYARIDGGVDAPGYFTAKENTGMKGVMADGQQTAPVYNIKGQQVNGQQRGLHIVRSADGKVKKVVVR